MMLPAWLGIGVVMLMLGIVQGAVAAIGRRYDAHPEIMRKAVHITMGLVCMTFPWIFSETWPAIVLSLIAGIWLLATKAIPSLRDALGSAINGTSRDSAGDIFFCAGIGLLFWLSHGSRLLYLIPVMILTFADAAAALVGVFYGRMRYQITNNPKSLEGSLAFFLMAFVCTYLPLSLIGMIGGIERFLLSWVLAGLITLLEALNWRGSDNALIPIGSYVLLRIYINAPIALLVAHLFVALTLTTWAILTAKEGSAWNT